MVLDLALPRTLNFRERPSIRTLALGLPGVTSIVIETDKLAGRVGESNVATMLAVGLACLKDCNYVDCHALAFLADTTVLFGQGA